MIEKEIEWLNDAYEKHNTLKLIYSQCDINQCLKPDYNLTYQISPCRC